jgi:long-chain acyl-CoA synthetase
VVNVNLVQLLSRSLTEKEGDSISFYGYSYAGKDVMRISLSVSSYLSESGVVPGDIVAVDMFNRPELLFIIFGSWIAGATVTPINVHLKTEEILYQLADSGAKILFSESSLSERVTGALKSQAGEVKDVTLDLEGNDRQGNVYKDVFDREMEYGKPFQNPEDLFIIYTSGTTGRPKGAVLTSNNVYREALQLQHVINIKKEDKMIIILPLFHVNNLMFSIATLMRGGSLIIMRKFDIKEFFQQVSRYRPTLFSAVPTIYKMLIDSWTEENGRALSSLETGICGAAPMPVKWFNDFERIYRIKIIEGYGLTEGTVASTINPRYAQRKVGSIGIPFPGQDVRIFSDNDEELPPGEIGEIVIRGPNVMKGYLNKDKETEVTLKNGWLHSGDIGYMDNDGYFYIVDRKKDMIIRGGENIFPKEVEDTLLKFPGISEAAVIGVPDELYGEEVMAFVVTQERGIREKDILEFCVKTMASYKCPKRIEFISEIPKNSIGKVQKTELRKLVSTWK